MEHLDVVIVGAGLSGIGAADHLQTDSPWASYAILEARDAIGGTWDLFRYPGVRSDSDMYTLGYSFRPWRGEQAIADGGSILRYIRDTARDAGIEERIRFHHRIVSADWSSLDGRWTVTAERSDTGETVTLTCGFLFSCSGYYRYDHGYLPDFAGMEQFGGTLVHPQAWPEDLDVTGQRVVVIGSGATAVTLIPALAETAAHVTMLQRSPSYIASVPARNPLAPLLHKLLPARYADTAIRWMLALGTQALYQVSQRWPTLVKRGLRRGLERELPDGYDIDTHFTPRYDPWDQRLCAVPDGDLFKAISSGAASVVTDHIDSFTETGLRLRSGAELDADVVVTATGLELLFLGDIAVSIDGEPVDLPGRLTYKGMMLEGVPNLAVAFGYTNASWTLKCDLTCDYVCRLLNHMRAGGFTQATPRNRHASVSAAPMLGLTSGYVQRSAARFPKQGSRFPWQVHQSYLRDWRTMKRSELVDEAMELTGPAVVHAGPEVARFVRSFDGRVAAVTGAGSGIGRALAVELAARRAPLALCDVDDVGLAETIARCEGRGVKVTGQHVDVADRTAVEAWAEQVVADHGRVNLIVNNAGVALSATVEAMSYDDVEWLMNINFWGVVHGTKAFLPHLQAVGEGHVVNISSVFGLISVPTQSAYNAAKFGVRGFTDALRIELDAADGGVSATTVHPGGIRTNIVRNARLDSGAVLPVDRAQAALDFDRMARTSPEKAARQILLAVQRNRRRALVGPDAKLIDLLSRLPAGLYQRALVRGARRRS